MHYFTQLVSILAGAFVACATIVPGCVDISRGHATLPQQPTQDELFMIYKERARPRG